VVVQLTDQERQALIWQDGDYLEVRSGGFCITRSEPKVQNQGWKFVHFLFDESGTGSQFNGDMTISGDFPNGPTLLMLYRRGEQMSPYALVSMVNRAWVHQVPLLELSLYKDTARYKRLAEPPLVSALGTFAQIAWVIGKGLFTNQEQEAQNMIDVLHRLMHRIAANHLHYYWEGGGGSQTGKL
jgi:hypothetical protein